MTAEKVYVDHLQHVIFSPHIDIKASLATYAEQADRWLRVRTAASVLAAGIIVGIVWQVIRRRNERISQTAVSTEA